VAALYEGQRLEERFGSTELIGEDRQVPAPMDYDLLYSFVVSFTGAILFLFVDRLEPNRTMDALLKFLVLFVSSAIIMQRMRACSLSLF
jgi:hypothetical protein